MTTNEKKIELFLFMFNLEFSTWVAFWPLCVVVT